MFRKLVSNLSFSPALIHEVGFYARRLRQEEITRRLTVLFVLLTLVMQSLAVFSPPESANASSEQDIIRGGVSSLDDFLTRYDHNEEDVKDIYTAAGITRSEILKTEPASLKASDSTYILSRYGQLTNSKREISMMYPKSTGGMGVRYFSPINDLGESSKNLKGWAGQSASLGWFAIIQANGAIATSSVPTSINPLNVVDPNVTNNVTSKNLTSDTGSLTIKPGDKLSYTLKASNTTDASVTASLEVRVADLLEYSRLIDSGGGLFDESDSTLSWPQVQLKPGESQERTFVVQLAAQLPATPTGTSDPSSFDCKMSITFGNTISSPIECPHIKIAENLFAYLPPLSPLLNVIFGAILLIVVSFFYLRTRQLKKEIRIIRHNFNTGTI